MVNMYSEKLGLGKKVRLEDYIESVDKAIHKLNNLTKGGNEEFVGSDRKPKRKNKRYTAFVKFSSGGEEEIDVDAPDAESARREAQRLLDDPKEYNPGGKIEKIVGPRVGLY